MKGLLALVIVLGVLIVAALVVVVVTMVNRMSGPDRETSAPSAAFQSREVPIPAGCQVVETVTSADRVILRLGTGERCNQLLILDLATGNPLGTVQLVPQ